MKKRAKIITTIASLCLAVALMAFGVYAATTATLSVTSNISFSVEDVFVSVWGSARLVANSGNPEDDTPLTSYGTSANPHRSYNVDANGNPTSALSGGEDSVALDGWTIVNANDNSVPAYDVDHSAVEYVLNIRNDSSAAVTVTIKDSATPTAGFNILPYIEGTIISGTCTIGGTAVQGFTVVNKDDMIGEQGNQTAATANSVTINAVTLNAGATMVITLTRTLIDQSASITNTPVSLDANVTITHAS